MVVMEFPSDIFNLIRDHLQDWERVAASKLRSGQSTFGSKDRTRFKLDGRWPWCGMQYPVFVNTFCNV